MSEPWRSFREGPLPLIVHPVPCRKCSCSGIYVDYDPRVTSGGVRTDCPLCKGRGWVEKSARAEEGSEP